MSCELIALAPDCAAVLSWEAEGGGLAASISPSPGVGFGKLRNDNGIAEIQIGMKEFECIGASSPHDHPHIYLNIGFANAILRPYLRGSISLRAESGS
jgi:uncharacterized Zn-finger protein